MAKKQLILTAGESLLIHRRRNSLGQVEAAKNYGVHADIYRDWEADKRKKDQPRYSAGSLKTHEVCYLLRRREGISQRELAGKIGMTRMWVIKMEEGTAPVERLREHWGV